MTAQTKKVTERKSAPRTAPAGRREAAADRLTWLAQAIDNVRHIRLRLGAIRPACPAVADAAESLSAAEGDLLSALEAAAYEAEAAGRVPPALPDAPGIED